MVNRDLPGEERAGLDQELATRLAAWEAGSLRRDLRRVDSLEGAKVDIGGCRLLSFSSNDYLGLAGSPALREAAARAVERWGAGAGASRLVGGSLRVHHDLEEALAAFKGAAAALAFSSGYATALGTIPALVGPGDVVVIDRLAHACLVDAARLSRAQLRVFAHNDANALERILRRVDARSPRAMTGSGVLSSPARRPRVLVVTESVFSMDGDWAPLRELVELKDRHGAWLLVDEAHATGLYGEHRRGLIDHFGLGERVEVQMGTLGKALGAAGGYIVGSRVLIDYLLHGARSFVFSTAPVPAAAAAARAGVDLVQSAEGRARCEMLWARVAHYRGCAFVEEGRSTPCLSAILPWVVGSEERALACSQRLQAEGIFVPAIRYPTVARGRARLRITLTAAHSMADVDRLTEALRALKESGPTDVLTRRDSGS